MLLQIGPAADVEIIQTPKLSAPRQTSSLHLAILGLDRTISKTAFEKCIPTILRTTPTAKNDGVGESYLISSLPSFVIDRKPIMYCRVSHFAIGRS